MLAFYVCAMPLFTQCSWSNHLHPCPKFTLACFEGWQKLLPVSFALPHNRRYTHHCSPWLRYPRWSWWFVHLLGQTNNDIVPPRNLHNHHNFELILTQVNRDCGFSTNLTVVRVAYVDDGNRNLGSGNLGTASILDEESNVIWLMTY